MKGWDGNWVYHTILFILIVICLLLISKKADKTYVDNQNSFILKKITPKVDTLIREVRKTNTYLEILSK
ncbi:MAG: hypothetical protein WC516_09275 [Patescibacteria group bacterium]|jgi:hypothetical protein